MNATESLNELRYSWHNHYSPNTKRRILRQFGYHVTRERVPMDAADLAERGFEFPDCHPADPAYSLPDTLCYTGSWTDDVFETEAQAIAVAFCELLEDYDPEYIWEVVLDPTRNAVAELAELAKKA